MARVSTESIGHTHSAQSLFVYTVYTCFTCLEAWNGAQDIVINSQLNYEEISLVCGFQCKYSSVGWRHSSIKDHRDHKIWIWEKRKIYVNFPEKPLFIFTHIGMLYFLHDIF